MDYLTKCMALELGPHGIRTNCVNPTVVLTPLGRAAWADAAKRDPMLASIPLGRFAEVDGVADCVLNPRSDAAAMVTSACVPVDGGFLAARAPPLTRPSVARSKFRGDEFSTNRHKQD